MNTRPLGTLLNDWEQGQLTREQLIEQMLHHLIQLYDGLRQLQAAYRQLERQQGGSHE